MLGIGAAAEGDDRIVLEHQQHVPSAVGDLVSCLFLQPQSRAIGCGEPGTLGHEVFTDVALRKAVRPTADGPGDFAAAFGKLGEEVGVDEIDGDVRA